MALKAIIFGVDGVLGETQEFSREVFNSVFAESGVGWEWGRTVYAELLKSTGGENLIPAFVKSRLPHWRQTDDVAHLISAMDRRHAALYRVSLEKAVVRLRPGMGQFLCAAARDGIRLAIATSENATCVAGLLRANLGATGAAVFETVVAASGVEKGARDIHSRTQKALDLDAEDCLAIVSSARDLRSAASAGIPTVITWGIYPQLQECADVLEATNNRAYATSSMILARWDPSRPVELLNRLREFHAVQKQSSVGWGQDGPAAWSLRDRELQYAGVGHLES